MTPIPDDKVRRIRARAAIGEKQAVIARDEGVSHGYVSLITNRKLRARVSPSEMLTWDHVGRKAARCDACGKEYGVTPRRFAGMLKSNWRCPSCGEYGWTVK